MGTNLDGSRPYRQGMRYRQHPMEFKRALVEQSLVPGTSVARLAREHGVNANQIFTWRRAYRQGLLGRPALLPVEIVEEPSRTAVADEPAEAPELGASGTDRLVLEHRGTRLVIEGRPDGEVLAQVLAAVLR